MISTDGEAAAGSAVRAPGRASFNPLGPSQLEELSVRSSG